MSEYYVLGEITVKFEMDSVEATSLEEAELKAKKRLKDCYHLDVFGYYHNPKTDVKIQAHAGEYDD